jgi:cytochrome c-type biogenesis protein
VGPTLAAILALAAGEGHPGQGAVLLAVYALGLGIPFLLFGLLFTRSLGLVRGLRRNWRVVSLASGSLLVAFGVLLATGELVRLTTRLARFTGISI